MTSKTLLTVCFLTVPGPGFSKLGYSAFHKTFDKLFPKFVWNSRSSLRTEQFHYVVVTQIANECTNLCHNELRNFHMKFSVKFTTSFQSSRFCWQLRNEIAQFVANCENFKRTSETVCQKFCETDCKITQARRVSVKFDLRCESFILPTSWWRTLLKITEKIVQRNVFLTKEKETRLKRWSAFEQLRPVEHLLRQ